MVQNTKHLTSSHSKGRTACGHLFSRCFLIEVSLMQLSRHRHPLPLAFPNLAARPLRDEGLAGDLDDASNSSLMLPSAVAVHVECSERGE